MQSNYNKLEEYRLVEAGFWVRFAAYTIDVLIVWLGTLIIKMPMWIAGIFITDAIWNRPILFEYSIMNIIVYLCGAVYFILLTYYTGSTLGKKVMNLQVVSEKKEAMTWTQVIYRETIGRFLSGVIYGVGYLMVVVDKRKRGLHDILADTKVIYAKEIKVTSLEKKTSEEIKEKIVEKIEEEISSENTGF